MTPARRRTALSAAAMTLLLAVSGCGPDAVTPTMATPPVVTAVATPTPPATVDPRYPLSGEYSLTLELGSSCTALPEAERRRQYSALIGYVADGRYQVLLSGGTFLGGAICTEGGGRFTGVGCDEFTAAENVGIATFDLENNNDNAHGGHIVERLAGGGWIEVIGSAAGPLRSAGDVTATGTAHVWYCATPSSYPFPCQAFAGCDTSLRLAFTRR